MAISKQILVQYSNLQEEKKEVQEKIKKLEKQIEKIENDGPVADKVRGGEDNLQSFRIEGFPYPEYSRKKTLLYARKATLTELEMELLETINQVELFITTIKDSHIRRIVSLRVIEGCSWSEVAKKVGGNTEDSVRKTFDRYIKK